jgi:hypothetical protein
MREVEFAFRVTSLSLEAGQRLCRDTRVRAPAALQQPPQRDGGGYWDSEMAQCDEGLPLHSTDRRRGSPHAPHHAMLAVSSRRIAGNLTKSPAAKKSISRADTLRAGNRIVSRKERRRGQIAPTGLQKNSAKFVSGTRV